MRSLGSLGVLLLIAGPSFCQDMPLSQVLLPNEGWTPVKLDAKSIGGLAGDGQGNVFVSDPEGKRILRIDKDGKIGVYVSTTYPVRGMAVRGGDQLYACQPEARRLVLVAAVAFGGASLDHLHAVFVDNLYVRKVRAVSQRPRPGATR
jgi:hypothetical protein